MTPEQDHQPRGTRVRGTKQASALAYFDCFFVFAMVTLALLLVVLLMKRSVAEKGTSAIAE